MNKDFINIAKTSLKILEKISWRKLLLEDVKKKSKIKKFDKLIINKQDLLGKINNYFDYEFSKLSGNIEDSSNKDMLFEILMIRFDILQLNRNAIISIFNSFKKNPKELIFLLPSIIDSIILMVSYTKISSNGIVGQLKIKGILLIYIATFLVWIKDETSSLEKTMTSLDNYLNNANKILKFIK